MQKVARLSAPVRAEDVGYVDLPRVGRGLAGDHVVEVGEDLRLDLPAQAETQEEHTAGNRGCESCLSNLGLNFIQMLRTFFANVTLSCLESGRRVAQMRSLPGPRSTMELPHTPFLPVKFIASISSSIGLELGSWSTPACSARSTNGRRPVYFACQ